MTERFCRPLVNSVDNTFIATSPLNLHPIRKRLWKGAGIIALLFISIQVAGKFLSDDKVDNGNTCGGDFLVAYSAGTLAREGRFEDLHDRHRFMDRIKEVGGTSGIEVGASVGPWMNPPFFLWPFMALDALPYRTALWTWWAISGACMLGASLIIAGMLSPAAGSPILRDKVKTPRQNDWRSTLLIPALLLLSMPAIQMFTHGQSSAVSLLLLATTVSFWRRGRGLEAGLAIGFLFYKPQLAMLFAAVLVIDQGRRALLGLTITGAVLLACMLLTMPQELSLYLQHATGAAAAMQSDGVFPWHRHATVSAFWRLLLQSDQRGSSSMLVRICSVGSATILLVAIAAAVLKHRRPELLSAERSPARMALRRDRLITATIVITPLLMPYYVDYDLLLLAIPATLFAGELLRRDNPSPAGKLALAWSVLYGWLYLNPGMAAITGVHVTVLLIGALAASLLARVLKPSEESASTTRRVRPGSPLILTN